MPKNRISEKPVSAKKRVRPIFSAMSVAHVDEEEEEEKQNSSSSSYCADRVLSNGDFYTGEWASRAPHGVGKYIWTNGCMYEGEWSGGKITGRGKFSWPSGATYDGEFSSGFLHGFGTYVGSTGDTYRGSWLLNLKHGRGRKSYANGDCYDGEWRWGWQDGQGKYIWANGNEYEGEWKNGQIFGKGSMLWANGNRYVGSWEDGLPKGESRFFWADGSFYVGNWRKDPNVLSGNYYPSSDSPSDVNLEDLFSIDLNDCKVCQGEKVPFLPSQKKLNWGNRGTADVWRGNYNNARKIGCGVTERGFDRICIWETDGDITCDIVDGNSAVVGQEVEDGLAVVGLHDGYLRGMQTPIKQRQPMELKRQGVTISKGHKNYELMLSLQIGIRHSVGKPAPAALLDLKSSAFARKERAWIKFPPEGTKRTPSHQSCEFKWKDYCPLVFRTLRKLFKLDPADYMMSICGNGALRELSSPGKSGSFFYMTHDDHYMIKTLKKSEVKVLLRMLPAYYNHVRTFENTLVTKFLGLHCVRLSGSAQKKVYFVIMGNLFCSNYTIHRRYDLKGSSHGRKTNRPESEIDANTTLKDLDLNFIFRLQKAWLQELHRQVDRDCDFLEQERIMDYSLLVGLHFTEASFPGDLPMKMGWTSGVETLAGKNESEQAAGATLRLCSLGIDQVLSGPTRWASVKLGLNMPARVERTVRRSNCESQLIGEMTGEFYDVIMFFGIIDILQDYDIIKKLEHAYKSFQYDPTSISAVDPKQYSKRFHDFIYKVFREDT